MSQLRIKEINKLHADGYVILQASKTTNAPIGWKHKNGDGIKWGYVDEMQDPELSVYRKTFNAEIISRGHCGFYLGHNQLCCIDLDTKKTTIEKTTALKDKIVKKLGKFVVVEKTKSNGFHIYFRFPSLQNVPDFTATGGANWIELYYSKRFIACYLSSTGLYSLIHSNFDSLKVLTTKQHATLMECLKPFRGKAKKKKQVAKKPPLPVDENTRKQVESYVDQITEKGLDITGDNPKWFRIGKALANAFGEQGFQYFNAVSQFSPKYNADTIKTDWDRFLIDDQKDREERVTISTFIKYCDDAGLYDLKTLQIAQSQTDQREFEIEIGPKDTFYEIVHTITDAFRQIMPICCVDRKIFYLFYQTHWIRINEKLVTDHIIDFVKRSTVSPKILRKIEQMPFKKAALEELSLTTMVDGLTPNTGDMVTNINVNCYNGILNINLGTGKRALLEHDAGYHFTGVLPYNYSPEAECPRFDKWLEFHIPDKDSQEAYYAFVASCLTKHKADIILMLAGPTSTGKSSLIEVTRNLIGLNNSVPISASTLFSGGGDSAAIAMQMENKLLAYDFDAQPFKALEVLLKVAAQEPIQGWQMGISRRPVVNYGRLMLAMNPHNYTVFTPAVARRFVTINMDVPVVRDNTIIPYIIKNELAGIFNKVLNVGLKHLLHNDGRINISKKMEASTTDFHIGQRDSIRWFKGHYSIPETPAENKKKTHIGSKLERLKQANPGRTIVRTSVSELYKQFRIWCEDEEGYPLAKIPIRKYFAQDMELLGVVDQKDLETNSWKCYLVQLS